MAYLKLIVWIINIASALGVIGLVLVQQGKGADMGAAFGSGASGSLFGASGSANFLSRTTAILATIFLVSCLALAKIDVTNAGIGVMSSKEAPAASAPAPAKAPASGQIPR